MLALFLFCRYKNPEKIKLAALPLRRKADREKRVYEETSVYNPFDYEVFLRQWPAEPYFNYLAAFSGPVIEDNDPGLTLLDHCYHWSKQLAVSAGYSEEKGMRGNDAAASNQTLAQNQLDQGSEDWVGSGGWVRE